ncbi:vegetative incompatibility protein HET-E-1 [Podospora conica]|nr:vegetative incompatibility protein HET-E-1 [Schizothecium conicum]
MRLLNTSTLEMREFISDDDRPRYATLSHTWGEQEISFAQWQNRHASPIEATLGGAKILACCRQALSDGFEWVWVDTCCIDKSSSAELSEAINSMFRWYRDAELCYAYLSDVPSAPTSSQEAQDAVQISRWFLRGWTLQELVAPKDLRFYSKDWRPLGTKAQFADMISKMTKIGTRFLFGDNLDLASIAQKMAWAAKRQTTRSEDQAYCLLGIFDINIPLLYGEGSKAFQRLQETLLTTYPEDQSLFVWGNIVNDLVEHPPIPAHVILSPEPIPWKTPDAGSEHHSLLAKSPADFAESHNVVPCPAAAEAFYHDPRNKTRLPSLAGNGGVKVDLAIFWSYHTVIYHADPPVAHCKFVVSCLLLCNREGLDESNGAFLIKLTAVTGSKWARIGSLVYKSDDFINHYGIFSAFANRPASWTLITRPLSIFLPGDVLVRRNTRSPKVSTALLPETWMSNARCGIAYFENLGVMRAGSYLGGLFVIRYPFKDKPNRALGIMVTRVASPAHAGGTCVKFDIFPCQTISKNTAEPPVREEMGGVSLLWHNNPFQAFPPGSLPGSPLSLCDSGHLMGNGGEGYSWIVEAKPFPKILARVEKFPLRAGGFIDVVDFVIGPEIEGEADSEDEAVTEDEAETVDEARTEDVADSEMADEAEEENEAETEEKQRQGVEKSRLVKQRRVKQRRVKQRRRTKQTPRR